MASTWVRSSQEDRKLSWIIYIFPCKKHLNGGFSIAMLVYKSVFGLDHPRTDGYVVKQTMVRSFSSPETGSGCGTPSKWPKVCLINGDY